MKQELLNKIDVIGSGVLENNNPEVLTVMNTSQKIEACQNTVQNQEAIELMLKDSNVKGEKKEGKILVGFGGGDMLELKPNDWLTRYEDGSFGFIENKEFELTYKPKYPKEYSNGQPINYFVKKILVNNVMKANEKTPELLAGLVDKNGNKMYEEKEGKFYLISKEGKQEIEGGKNIYIKKDATGGFYPNTEKAFKKLIVLSKDEVEQIKNRYKSENITKSANK